MAIKNPKIIKVPIVIKKLLQDMGSLAASQGMRAYVVGGCVRDWILGKPDISDVDVCIEGDGISFANSASSLLGAKLITHKQFGTATLELPGAAGIRVDVATCRKETYQETASYPKVIPGVLSDDLFRRDFTINAMAISMEPGRLGALIDPYNGMRDLKSKKLKILHAKSFVDDPSRMLRAVRFLIRYSFSFDSGSMSLLKKAISADVFSHLNRGRIRKELIKMLLEKDPVKCFIMLGKWLETY
jgi:tRNA nucleotidyltransferase (CCA-adding enzyme)